MCEQASVFVTSSFIAGQFIVNGSSCDEWKFAAHAKRQKKNFEKQQQKKTILIKLNDLQGDTNRA